MSPVSERRPLLQELAAQGFRLTAQRPALVEITPTASAHLDASAPLLALGRRRPLREELEPVCTRKETVNLNAD